MNSFVDIPRLSKTVVLASRNLVFLQHKKHWSLTFLKLIIEILFRYDYD